MSAIKFDDELLLLGIQFPVKLLSQSVEVTVSVLVVMIVDNFLIRFSIFDKLVSDDKSSVMPSVK